MLVIIAKKTVAIEETKAQSVLASLVRSPEVKLTYKTEWYKENVHHLRGKR